jgi:genome maintenance exonuclease 1
MMQFKHESPSMLKYEPLSVSYSGGNRFYEVEPGVLYPSMTSVLSILSRDSIAKWKKRVGEKKAEAISRKARNRGNEVHQICENFLNNESPYIKGELPDAIELFNTLKSPLIKYLNRVYHIEVPLYSMELGVAGRADLIGEWMGVPVILDFKTSARPKKEEWLSNYYMQGAGYAQMYKEMTGIEIEHILVLIAVASDIPKVQMFPAAVKDWIGPLKDTIKRYNDEEKMVS